MKKLSFVNTIICMAFLLCGCAATGEKFRTSEATPENKGVIYFYRRLEHMGMFDRPMLADNGKHIQRILNGEYIRYETDPGHHDLRTDSAYIDKGIDLTVEAEKTYYVRAGV